MKLILTTCFGIEDVVAKELKEKDREAKILELRKGRVMVDVKKLEPVFTMHSIHHVIKMVSIFRFKTIQDISQKLKETNLDDLLDADTFRVTSERACTKTKYSHSFTSIDIQKIAGDIILKKYKKKVDLENFDKEIRVDVIDNVCFVGIQLTKNSLHKRGYRVFEHLAALKPTLAYAMLRIIDLRKNESLLDPMCGGGTIPIEAALTIKPKKIFASDKNEKYVQGAKLNAKNAGVLDKIGFETKDCKDMSWVGEVDKVVTNPPFGVRIGRNRKFLKKLYSDFLKACNEVVKDKICLLSLKSNLFKHALKKHGKFRIVHERIVGHGNIYPKLYVIEKK